MDARSTTRPFGTSRLFGTAAWILLTTFAFGDPAEAYDQWRWTVTGSSQVFNNKQAAQAHMRTLSPTNRTQHYTVEEGPISVTETVMTYEYTAPRLDPNAGDWSYDNQHTTASYPFADEASARADLAARFPSPVQCPATTVEDLSGIWNVHTSNIGVSTSEKKAVTIKTKIYHVASATCIDSDIGDQLLRMRTVSCPTDYSPVTTPPRCAVPGEGRITGAMTQACHETGNPCNAVSGEKVQRETDYAGAGLRFTRTFRSQSLESSHGLGVGWMHSYRANFILGDGSTNARGFVRPDGSIERMRSTSGRWVSMSGTGLQFADVGTEAHVYLNDGGVEVYDSAGRFKELREPGGRITTLQYSGNVLTSVVGPFGHTLTLEYENGRLARLIDPDGQEISYQYDGSGNLIGVTYPNGTSRTYHYEDVNFPNHLTGITDESGARFATFAYDGQGRAVLTEHAGGVDGFTFVYSATNTVITDARGNTTTVTVTNNSSPRRITSIASGGTTRSFGIPTVGTDPQRRPTSTTDANGVVTTFSYSRDHLLSKTEASGTPLARTTSYLYGLPGDDRPTKITEPGRVTDLVYDTPGNLLTKTVTDTASSTSRTWTYTYNSAGQVLTEDGPRTDVSDVTTYTYYTCTTGEECGQLETVTNALSQTTTFNTYNAHGQPLTITDPNGVVTTLAYDLRQRLTSRTIDGETTSFEYWPTGLLKKATLPDGSFTLYTYDDAQRLADIEDGEGNRIEYTLDAMSNRTAESVFDPSSALTLTRTQVFNSLNQLWKQLGAAGTAAVTTTFGYDGEGNQTSANAPLGRNTSQLYDQLNRLKQITDPGSGITQFAYDAHDNLTSVTDPRTLVTSYSYNGFGDLMQQVSPDTGTTVNTYDSGGNLATTTDARSKTGTYSYDALNRATSIAYPDRTITYTYDSGTNGLGRLTGASASDHSLAWSYDAQGRVIGKGQTVGAVTKSVGYGYTDGNLTSLVTPSGQTITYGHANGRIDSITLNGSTTILSDVLYEPFGPVAGWTWGNSTIAARVHDLDGKPTDVDSAGAYTYAYDDAFRITGITDVADGSKSWSYGYDVLDRLNSASRTAETIGYTYDANGNRLTQSGSSTASYTVSGASNRVTSITGTPARTYSYDASGNVTGYAGLAFTYTDAGRMSSVTSGATTTSYLVNALGQRVKKSNASATLLFVYDESGHLIGEYDASGALVQETIWMNDTPVAALRPNGSGGVNVLYVHTDHLNTPRRISRPSDNAILWRWDSDPFGSATTNEDPDGDTNLFVFNPRFPGQYFDAESGLSYNYMRDGYDSAVGRYTQSDPIGLMAGINTYAYVRGNPIWFVDPLGLQDQGSTPSTDDENVPTDGHPPQVQKICDLETDRATALDQAATALSKGDYGLYDRLIRRANDYERRYQNALREYYESVGVLPKVPKTTTSPSEPTEK